MNWIYDNPADIASVSCHSRAESMNAAGDDSDNETDYEASAIDDNNRGICLELFFLFFYGAIVCVFLCGNLLLENNDTEFQFY